jgi:hypothetical protein
VAQILSVPGIPHLARDASAPAPGGDNVFVTTRRVCQPQNWPPVYRVTGGCARLRIMHPWVYREGEDPGDNICRSSPATQRYRWMSAEFDPGNSNQAQPCCKEDLQCG